MPVFLIIFFIILFAVVVIFSFPQFSPIPYYPSNMKDKDKILRALKLTGNQTVIDLGAGDGVVIFEAAKEASRKKLSTRFVALELNPILVLILHIRRLFHPSRKSIKIVWGDMFKINYFAIDSAGGFPPVSARFAENSPRLRAAGSPSSSATYRGKKVTFYLYISPWLIEAAVGHALSFYPDARFVSYYYPIKSLKKREHEDKGVHTTFSYPKS